MTRALESTELRNLDASLLVMADETIGRGIQVMNNNQLGPFQKSFALAGAIAMLREQITDGHIRLLSVLQNSPLGFLTDKKEGYGPEVLRTCAIEVVLRGLRFVGNEFNIIAERVYITKAGFSRQVREYPGLTNLKLDLEPPVMSASGAVVEATASWSLHGNPDSISRRIPVKVNAGMGADAVLGKATRKLLASVYGVLTGSEHALPEGDVDEAGGNGRPVFDPSKVQPGAAARLREVAKTDTDPEPKQEPAPAPTTAQATTEPTPATNEPVTFSDQDIDDIFAGARKDGRK